MSENNDRTPPKRVRLTGLQEAQVPELLQVEAKCAAMYHAKGFDAAEVPVRAAADLAGLVRHHSVHVAEADHVPVALLAWRDESPGVAYLADLQVHPDYQRFGIGTKLLAQLNTEARAHGFDQIVVRVWEKATWALAFYRRHGFVVLGDVVPEKVALWKDERSQGRPIVRPGEVLMWAAVPPAPPIEEEETEEAPPTE
ncbi:MAG: GNAT family N-acetyltransferase [Byssovorax sp.]